MEWITNIDLGEASTQGEALNLAKDIITKWCKDNNLKGYIYNNSAINRNKNGGRFIGITASNGKWYVYQLIVSSKHKQIGEVEELVDEFNLLGSEDNNETCMVPIYDEKETYYAKLVKPRYVECVRDRKYKDGRNWECLNDVPNKN